jgi:hypothetical protein
MPPQLRPRPVQRSAITKNLKGSIYLANNFNEYLLPNILRSLQVYSIIDRDISNQHQPTSTRNDLKTHFVIGRLVCKVLGVSNRTIENYFRRFDNVIIGYVVHSKRIIDVLQTIDILSPSNSYTLISLAIIKEWYRHSSRVKGLIDVGRAQMWPIPVLDERDNEDDEDDEEDKEDKEDDEEDK